jgi:hypothetical protein
LWTNDARALARKAVIIRRWGPRVMIEALYWWEEAAKFKQQASTSEGAIEQAELLELAETCEAVAIKVEDQMTAG